MVGWQQGCQVLGWCPCHASSLSRAVPRAEHTAATGAWPGRGWGAAAHGRNIGPVGSPGAPQCGDNKRVFWGFLYHCLHSRLQADTSPCARVKVLVS